MKVSEYLQSRHVNLSLHRPVVDEEERVATFFLYNCSGQLVGYQQHRPDAPKTPQKHGPKLARYFTYRKQPTHSLWGLESLYQSNGVVFLTEGLFDAARLTEKGQSALACLCNNPQRDLKNWLDSLARPVVVVADNDKAGKALAKFGNFCEVCPEPGSDLSDSSEDFVNWLVQKYAAFAKDS